MTNQTPRQLAAMLNVRSRKWLEAISYRQRTLYDGFGAGDSIVGSTSDIVEMVLPPDVFQASGDIVRVTSAIDRISGSCTFGVRINGSGATDATFSTEEYNVISCEIRSGKVNRDTWILLQMMTPSADAPTTYSLVQLDPDSNSLGIRVSNTGVDECRVDSLFIDYFPAKRI